MSESVTARLLRRPGPSTKARGPGKRSLIRTRIQKRSNACRYPQQSRSETLYITDTNIADSSQADDISSAGNGYLTNSAIVENENQEKGLQEVTVFGVKPAPRVELNHSLHQNVPIHTTDPILIQINAPPPYPVHLIDGAKYVSDFPAKDYDARLSALILMSQRATYPKPLLNPLPATVALSQSFTDQNLALTAEKIAAKIQPNGPVLKQVISTNRQRRRRRKTTVLWTETTVKRKEGKKFKDVLEEILRPHFRKWAGLCRNEFPDDVYWKSEGNLASLVSAYFEACSLHCKKLVFKSFYLKKLPPVVWLRHYLRSLNISFKHFKVMPEGIFHLRNLMILKARNNPIVAIGDGISRLLNLRYLVISFCLIEEFPKSCFALPALEILDISYNLLRENPSEITKIRFLRVINVSGNLMSDLPASMMRLPRLSSVLAADSYVSLTSGRRAITSTYRLMALRDLSADSFSRHLMAHNRDPRLETSIIKARNEVVAILRTGGCCEWCDWPLYGLGHSLVKAETIKKLRANTFILRYQVCGRCCRNPYHVFTETELHHHIELGQHELERLTLAEQDKKQAQAAQQDKIKRTDENKKKRGRST